ncbi:hypothetical protein FJZ31_04215 [Candidatus Poribacteria bacterium]|nr:hypothetical protein [Candidatus Poribacteria bacterium]
MKKRGDTNPFDKLEPVITGKDGTIKSGQIGTFGPSYFDNFIIGDIGTGPEGLQSGWTVLSFGKLSTTWGAIKSFK